MMRPRARIISYGQLTVAGTFKLDTRGLQPGELAICVLQIGAFNPTSDPTSFGFVEVINVAQSPASLRIYEKIWTDTDPKEINISFGSASATSAILFGVNGSSSHQYITGNSAAAIPTIPSHTPDTHEQTVIKGITSANGNRYKLGSHFPALNLQSGLLDTDATLAVWLTDASETGDPVPAMQATGDITTHAIDNYVGFVILLEPAEPGASLAYESYENFAPLVDAYGDPQGFMRRYMHAIGRMFRQVEEVASDDVDGTPGFGTSLDIDKAPDVVLPWLAVLAGNPAKGSPIGLRDHIRRHQGSSRGTVQQLVGTIQEVLTGTKTVYVFERQGGAYRMGISVLASESPGAAKLNEIITAEKAAGLIVTVTELTGGDFNTLTGTHTDFTDVTTTYTDFDAIIANPSL